MFRRVLQGFLIASGALIVVAGGVTIARRRRGAMTGPCACAAPGETSESYSAKSPRDYFQITCSRGKDIRPQWLLQGFGKYRCFLFFDSWQEAMEQATLGIESLGIKAADLVQLS